MASIHHVPIGEFTFECQTTGESGNPAVIFLHGFPETSHMWMGLMERLAKEGFFCIAPNLRGYSKDACPKGVANYTIGKLSSDVIQLADHFKAEQFHLVGHDWGSFIGWHTAYHHPERLLSWNALSVPHPKAFGKALKIDPIQKKKSRYIGFFLIPMLPEFMLRWNNFKRLRKLWRRSSEAELADYLRVFHQKGTLSAALNYYRANIGKGKQRPVKEIQLPTLFIWGKYDLAVGRVAAEGNEPYVNHDYSFVELESGHWLLQASPKEVYEHLHAHLKKHST